MNEENDANVEVNTNLTHDFMTDNSDEIDCDAMSANAESNNSNKDEVDVSDGIELNSNLIAMRFTVSCN